jgi:hypothetical protein
VTGEQTIDMEQTIPDPEPVAGRFPAAALLARIVVGRVLGELGIIPPENPETTPVVGGTQR